MSWHNLVNRYSLVRLRAAIGPAIAVVLLYLLLHYAQWYGSRNPIDDALARQLVMSQFTVVSITMSIIALVSNFSDRRVFGLRLSEAIFPGSVFYQYLFAAPIVLSFMNLILLISKAEGLSVLYLFCISIWIVSTLILKIVRSVFDLDGVANRVEARYYRGYLRQIRKAGPSEPPRDSRLPVIFNSTVKYIADWDVRMFENIDMEHRVATTLLAGNKHLYQNYYFELSRFNDPLTHIAKYSEEMFLRGRYIEGIQNITSVMKCLNYFKVVAVSNQSLYEPIERASRSIKLIEDDVTAADYQKRLVMLEMELLIQKDLYTTLDFSGYRMYDEGLLALALPVCEYDGGFSDYYRSLEESERLSARQKLRLKANLLDDLSEIMIFDPLARRDVEIDYVNSLRKNYSYLKRKFANSFLAMKPIALMLLSAMDNKDDACVRMYALRGFDERLFEALWILCVMGLIKHLLCGSERLFIGEMTINDQEARKYLAAVPFDRLVGKTELLKELHAELLACYDIGPASDKRCELAFGYDVRLSFDEKSGSSTFLVGSR